MNRPERRSVRPSRNGGNHGRVSHREISASETAAAEMIRDIIKIQESLPIGGPWKQHGLTAQRRERLNHDSVKRVFLFRVVLLSGTAFSADVTVFATNGRYDHGTAAIVMSNTALRGQRRFFHWSRDLAGFEVREKQSGQTKTTDTDRERGHHHKQVVPA